MGGGGTKTEYVQSPEQREMYQKFMPMMEQMTDRAMKGQPIYDVPEMPDSEMYSPTKDWWQNVSPEIKQGLWQPYQDSANQLSEQFGGQGMMGSPLTGTTGAFGNALGQQVASRAGAQMPMQAWQMGAEARALPLQHRQDMISANRMPWEVIPGMMGGTYSTPVVNQRGGGAEAFGSAAFTTMMMLMLL